MPYPHINEDFGTNILIDIAILLMVKSNNEFIKWNNRNIRTLVYVFNLWVF